MEEPPSAEAMPRLGHHARSVVTEAMPMRFVDEVGAHLASALAIATAKALVREEGSFGLGEAGGGTHGTVAPLTARSTREKK